MHDDRVSSVSVKLDGSMDINDVNSFLGYLVQMNPENMYRYKGILAIAGEDERVVFQVSVPFLALHAGCNMACHQTASLTGHLEFDCQDRQRSHFKRRFLH